MFETLNSAHVQYLTAFCVIFLRWFSSHGQIIGKIETWRGDQKEKPNRSAKQQPQNYQRGFRSVRVWQNEIPLCPIVPPEGRYGH